MENWADFWERVTAHSFLTSGSLGPRRAIDSLSATLDASDELPLGQDRVVLVYCSDPILAILRMLTCWRQGSIPLLVDGRTPRHRVVEVSRQVAYFAEWNDSGIHVQSPTTCTVPTGHTEDAVLLQVTSGTTGQPAVVMRTRQSLFEELDAYLSMPYLDSNTRTVSLLCSPIHTFGLIGGVLAGLIAGKAVSIETALHWHGLSQTLKEDLSSVVVLTVPSVLGILTQRSVPRVLSESKSILFAGESPSQRLVNVISSSCQAPVNIYGTTETGLLASSIPESLQALAPAQHISHAIESDQLKVMRSASPYLSAGIRAERWREPWFLTGDVVRPSGAGAASFTIAGRSDTQVSVHGFKVSLVEIEHVLFAIPSCKDAVVTYEDGLVTAYVHLEPGSVVDQIHKPLRERLLPHEFPRRIYNCTVLPKTPSGKSVRDPEQLRATIRSR